MFGSLINKTIGAAVDTVTGTVSLVSDLSRGELPTRQKILKLLADGATVYQIADATGHAPALIRDIVDGAGE